MNTGKTQQDGAHVRRKRRGSRGRSAGAIRKTVEQVTVTGSRVISDITLSPTPLTVVTAEQLQATTPTNIPDALNKLPDFIGGASPRSQGNGSEQQAAMR